MECDLKEVNQFQFLVGGPAATCFLFNLLIDCRRLGMWQALLRLSFARYYVWENFMLVSGRLRVPVCNGLPVASSVESVGSGHMRVQSELPLILLSLWRPFLHEIAWDTDRHGVMLHILLFSLKSEDGETKIFGRIGYPH